MFAVLTTSGCLVLANEFAHGTENGLPKNIVLIMADDIGIECFGCYGGTDYPTPNIDRLAAEGLRFSHAYSQPLCTPTRLEIMTGLENHRNWQCFGVLPKSEKTFGHLMQSFGYRTCIAGKWQLTSYDPPDFPNADRRRALGMPPRDAGFDAYSLFHAEHTEDKGSRYANPTFLRNGTRHHRGDAYGEDLNVDFMLDFMRAHKEERMFVYYPMALPHWPMVPTPDSSSWADPDRRLDESVDHFPDMVRYMDKLVGRLVEGIHQLGLSQETLVLFYSDNGTDRRIRSNFRGKVIAGGKNTTTQAGIRVPLIAHWPGNVPVGVSADLIDPSDFLPTLAKLAGRELPTDWQTDGFNFSGTILGTSQTERQNAFFWYDPRPGWDKESFSRSIFAVDHHYKLFNDGQFFDIAGEGFREVKLEDSQLSVNQRKAKQRLQTAMTEMMKGRVSSVARTEVDAFGNFLDQGR